MTLDVRGGSFEISDSSSLWSGQTSMIFTKKPILLGIGIVPLWNVPEKMADLVVHHLTNQLLIFWKVLMLLHIKSLVLKIITFL